MIKYKSQEPLLFHRELESLLEDGIEPVHTWLDDDNQEINMRIAMQDLMEDDPWMSEPWTEEEMKQIMEAEKKAFERNK
jgi:hypothetical protein